LRRGQRTFWRFRLPNSPDRKELFPASLVLVQGPQPFNAVAGYFPDSSTLNPLAVADVNGDGYADVVLNGPSVNNGLSNVPSLAVLFGQANGQLKPPVLTPGISLGALVAGDVDGDGSQDIVTATVDSNNSPVIAVLLNNGKGNFSQSSTVPYSGNDADSLTLVMDGDGKPDLLFSVEYAIYFSKNLGGGSFAAPVSLAATALETRTLCVGDFNGDGRPDIVYVGPDEQIHLLINQGGDSFSSVIPSGISGQAGYFAIGDFNRDGHLDRGQAILISAARRLR